MRKPACGTAALAAFLAACAANPTPSAPTALRVAPGQKLVLEALGRGTQVYICSAGDSDPSQFKWTLKGPDATLYDDTGNVLGHHYAGPTWELNGGSRVTAEVSAHADAPKPDAIPWLLLSARPDAGTGLFAGVVNVQRLDTVGGKAPAIGCDAAHADATTSVPYQARYYFYSAAP